MRPANENDLESLIHLRRQSTEGHVGPEAADQFERDWHAWFSRERRHRVFWLAEVDAVPVGATNLMIFDRMPRPGSGAGRWGYLANMYVAAEHRNRGIGSALLAAVLDHARQARLVRVVLSPTTRSRPFYERAGFVPALDLLLLTLNGEAHAVS